jgi:hypothetical protein
MPFKLPEYDDAFGRFFMEAAHELALAREPLLAQISFERSPGALGSVIEDEQGNDVDLPPGSMESEGSMRVDAIRDGDLDEFLVAVDALSEAIADGYMRHLVGTIDVVTSATGNIVDASGRPNYEAFMEALEALEWSLTDDDKLAMPSLIMNPAHVDKFPPLTDEQKRRLEELQERKLKELLAARRSRRLS